MYWYIKSGGFTPIPLDKVTLHSDDYERVGWFDMPQGDPPRGSVPIVAINFDAVQQRENAQLLERIARSRNSQ